MNFREFSEVFLTTLAAGDFDRLAPMLDPDFVVHEAAALPYGGDYHGVDGWRQLSNAIAASWAGFRIERKEVYGETADSLVIRLFLKGRSRRTGIPFETSVLELWRFREGRLREITPYYWDTHLLASIND